MIQLRFTVIADTFATMVRTAIQENIDLIHTCHALLLLGDLPAQAYPALREEFQLPMRGLCVLGNHDGEHWSDWLPRYQFEHLHLNLAAMRKDGREFIFGGFSGSERYKPDGHWQWDNRTAENLLANLAPCDILLTHTAPEPPPDYPADNRHSGLPALGGYIDKHQPKLALHGHFHQTFQQQRGETVILGCYGVVLLDCTIDGDSWQIQWKELNVPPWN